MQYSSVVEPVGIHSLAETNPDEYNKALIEFNNSLNQCISRIATKWKNNFQQNKHKLTENPGDSVNISSFPPSIKCCFNGSHAFVQSNTYWAIYDILKELRCVTFTEHGFLFRAVVSKTDIRAEVICGKPYYLYPTDDDLKNKSGPRAEVSTYDFKLTADALRMLGELNRLKTAGIHADKTLANYVSNYSGSTERCFIKNYFPTGKGRLDFETYFDIPIDDKLICCDMGWAKLINIFNKSRFIDSKLPKYYVGFMANWVRYLDLSKDWDGSMFNSADGYISRGKLTKYNNVFGIDLVYATLLDRVFSPKLKENVANGERIKKTKSYFALTKPVQKLIAKDKWRTQIPSEVLSHESWHSYVSNLVEKHEADED